MRSNRPTNYRGFSLLLACLIAAVCCVAVWQPDSSRSLASDSHTPGVLTREARLAVFDDVWSTINQRYYDRNFHGLDWDAQRSAYRDLAANAGTSQELYLVLRQMIASLNDSHTRVFAPEEKFDWWRPRFITIGISIKEVDGVPTVVQVERNSAPHRAGIRAGDVIVTVDGQPAKALVRQRLARAGSTRGLSRSKAFAGLMDGPSGTPVEVGWNNREHKTKTARFERYWLQRELGMRVRESKNATVVELDVFTKPIAASFATALRKDLRRARGIVLDFRNNGGGDAEAMADIASAFLVSGVSLGQFTDRFGSSYTISTRLKSPFIARVLEQTQTPVIVLVSDRTSSAAEIFVAALKAAGRAQVIGTETCGCVLAIRNRHALPDGGTLDVSEMDFQTPSGQRLEKQAIKPDQVVRVRRADLYAEKDRAMELAVLELKTRSANLN